MTYTLFELNEFIRRVLALNLSEPVWVKTELSHVKFSRGHCYLDLVEKSGEEAEVIAQGQAVIWQTHYRKLHRRMGFELDTLLQQGMEVLLQVSIDFHERYGLKLIVQDIDPNYTLGKLEIKRRETIQSLKNEGLLEKNKACQLPVVIQRIAVISSETAAGWVDFNTQLGNNPYGYQFALRLFPAAMQGVNVVNEVTRVLDQIPVERFDVVVLIRGGGSRLDLAAFDELDLCRKIAHCQLPVVVGIGHEIDQSVADLVAHTSLKTPTAVAEFIIQRNMQFETQVLQLESLMREGAFRLLHDQRVLLNRHWQLLEIHTRNLYQRQTLMLDFIRKEIPGLSKNLLQSALIRIQSLEKAIDLLDPRTIFARGFSLTEKDGAVVSDSDQVKHGDQVVTFLHQGSFTSVVKKENKNEHQETDL